MSAFLLLPMSLVLAVAACSDGGSGADTRDASDTAPDTTVADATVDATTTTPDVAADTAAEVSTDTTSGTGGADADTSQSDLTIAVPGARCALDERIGLVEISAPAFGPNGYVSGVIKDKPDPWYGDFELTTDQCGFHRMSTAACPPCENDELCARGGQCVAAPVNRTDVTLTLSAGEATQDFDADGTTGDVYGDLTLEGDTFALAITFAGHRVTLAATSFPAPIVDLAGTLAGGYDAPTALDLSWTPTAAVDTSVYTLIPINHHAGGPTFTECAVYASTGALHVGEAMLTPLAVSTGLEFQGVHHLRFAAAETPYGCVEIRFTGGQQYVNLEPGR